MTLRKDQFLAAVFALSLGASACGGGEEPAEEPTTGEEDPMTDDGMGDDTMDDGMDDGMADDGMADDGMEDDGPLPE
ncbi:MAG: hypothetical protein JJ863_26535 [Deltaproteobacteria bacterium]|nr:hypothetical protein [Deltaproteobacteria bacterium]